MDYIGANIKCNFCGETKKDTYFINATNDTEFETFSRDFNEFADTPVLVVCEDCLQGHCGIVPDSSPTRWFHEIYPSLVEKLKVE